MGSKNRNKITSWIFVYALLIVAVVFASQSQAVVPPDLRHLSPVVLGGDAPALTVDSIMNRHDI